VVGERGWPAPRSCVGIHARGLLDNLLRDNVLFTEVQDEPDAPALPYITRAWRVEHYPTARVSHSAVSVLPCG
jgi:hypothetical protein